VSYPGPAQAAVSHHLSGSPSAPIQSHFIIPQEKRSAFANLYGLLTAADVLEQEFAHGRVNDGDRQQLYGDLRAQFTAIENALNLSGDHVRKFLGSCDFDYDWLKLFIDGGSSPVRETRASLVAAAQMGQDFATLSDLCDLNSGETTAKEFSDYIGKVRAALANIGAYPNNAKVKERTDKWVNEFRSLKPNDRVPKSLSDQLQMEIALWRQEALS
jgi:hypothetical protein